MSGGGVGNAGNFAPSATLYYVHSLKPDLKLGLGFGSYMGAGLDYGNNWSGRYYAEKVSLTTAAINPTVGYRVNPWLSMGGGVNIVYGKMSDRTAINTPLEEGDGRLKFDATDVGYGFNAGVLFEVSPQTRFGITYASQVDLNFKDDLRFNNLPDTGIRGSSPEGVRHTRLQPQGQLELSPAGGGRRLSGAHKGAGAGGHPQLAGLEQFRTC